VQKYSLLTSIAKNAEKINGIWPSLPISFYDNFFESLKDNKVTDKELTIAVKHVRDTCGYPTPLISEFINFIKKIREEYSTEDIKLTPEEIEANKIAEEEADRIYLAERDAFNKKLLDGEFEPKDETPEGF